MDYEEDYLIGSCSRHFNVLKLFKDLQLQSEN